MILLSTGDCKTPMLIYKDVSCLEVDQVPVHVQVHDNLHVSLPAASAASLGDLVGDIPSILDAFEDERAHAGKDTMMFQQKSGRQPEIFPKLQYPNALRSSLPSRLACGRKHFKERRRGQRLGQMESPARISRACHRPHLTSCYT